MYNPQYVMRSGIYYTLYTVYSLCEFTTHCTLQLVCTLQGPEHFVSENSTQQFNYSKEVIIYFSILLLWGVTSSYKRLLCI